MWEGVRLCYVHYNEKWNERNGQLQREQQARDAAWREREAKKRQERHRAEEERAAKIVEARNQIPGLLAQLRASRVPRESFEVSVRGKRRRREGWLLFKDSREGFMGYRMLSYRVTTEGEFINDTNNFPNIKNPEARTKMIDGEYPYEWVSSFNWIMIADRLRELLSNGG